MRDGRASWTSSSWCTQRYPVASGQRLLRVVVFQTLTASGNAVRCVPTGAFSLVQSASTGPAIIARQFCSQGVEGISIMPPSRPFGGRCRRRLGHHYARPKMRMPRRVGIFVLGALGGVAAFGNAKSAPPESSVHGYSAIGGARGADSGAQIQSRPGRNHRHASLAPTPAPSVLLKALRRARSFDCIDPRYHALDISNRRRRGAGQAMASDGSRV